MVVGTPDSSLPGCVVPFFRGGFITFGYETGSFTGISSLTLSFNGERDPIESEKARSSVCLSPWQ